MTTNDSITVPKLIAGLIMTTAFSVLGWFVSQVYQDVRFLQAQVQDISKVQSSVTTKQILFSERFASEEKSCSEYRQSVEDRFDQMRLEIDRKANKEDAQDRYTGTMAKTEWAIFKENLEAQQEINDQQHVFMWSQINALESDFMRLHDALREEYRWTGKQ